MALHTRGLVGAVAVGLLVLAGCDLGTQAVTYDAPGWRMDPGDVNGDGKVDILVNLDAVGADFLIGDGAGGFESHTWTLVQPVPGGGQTRLGDVNEDGWGDLIVGIPPPPPCDRPPEECPPPSPLSYRIAVLVNDGAGGFAAPVVVHTVSIDGFNPLNWEMGDLNADGVVDLVVAESGPSRLSVLLGDGTGGFGSPVAWPTGGMVVPVVQVADMNGDGHIDVVVAGVSGLTGEFDGYFAVLAGDGVGGLGAPAIYPSIPLPGSITGISRLAIGDYDGDGHLDLLGENRSTDVAIDSYSLLLSDGVGGFAPAVERPAPLGRIGLGTGDFDGDDADDLIVTKSVFDSGSGEQRVSGGVFFGAASNQFSQSRYLAPGGDILVQDFNADGKPDAAFRGDGEHIVVLLNGWDGRPS